MNTSLGRLKDAVAALVLLAMTMAHAAETPPASLGPFEIASRMRQISSGAFPNISANPFGRMTVSDFEVRYRGTPVKLIDGNAQVSRFSEAKFLEGAPRPAILASEAGTYLISEQNGQLSIEVLASATTDFATWQWLDGDNGQPAPPTNITVRDASAEPRWERGGHLLLLNRRVVLDVATLKHYPVVVNTDEILQKIGGYNAGNEPTRAMSPARTQLLMIGNRYENTRFEYGLVVVDYATGRVYSVPFDRNALRFESVWDATPEWIARNFEWTRDKSGIEHVQLRKDFKPSPWQGKLRGTRPRVDYLLYPTEPQVADEFYGYLQRAFGASTAALPGSSQLPNTRVVAVSGSLFYLFYNASEKTLFLSAAGAPNADLSANYRLIEQIGQRFNTELAQGKYQNLFTEYPGNR
jgi:hypothetical protein